MTIRQNPFCSEVYEKHWVKHFNKNQSAISFPFLKGVSFTRHNNLPIYFNLGKYKTLGMSYESFFDLKTSKLGNKVLLIYDVPQYFEIDKESFPKNSIHLLSVPQYNGFVIDLRNYSSLDEYISEQFTSKAKGNLLRRLRKMESRHEITYKWFYGSITEEDYESLYNKLYEFIEIKFGDDVTKNSHTPVPIRNWHKTLWYEMINKGQAAFFVIYDGKEPINVSLNYMAENIIFSMIPAYNLDYIQYGIGNIQNLKIIEWGIHKGFEYFDLGKVSYGYKWNWSNLVHSYEYHIIWNKKSLISSVLALAMYSYFSTKQFLRKKYHDFKGYE